MGIINFKLYFPVEQISYTKKNYRIHQVSTESKYSVKTREHGFEAGFPEIWSKGTPVRCYVHTSTQRYIFTV